MSMSAPIRRVGDASAHHFFGYYNKSNFDRDDKRLLGQRVDRFTGDITGQETAIVGYFDLSASDQFHEVGQTTTWNWQMGSQLQWVGKANQIIHNARWDGPARDTPYPDFCSKLVDLDSGTTRTLPLPVYVLAPNGDYALCVNYSRFMVTHKTIGYPATQTEPELDLAPADDGIYRMDMATGDYRLILSLAQLKAHQPRPSMGKAIHWITHLEANPSGSRFLFIHRWTERVEDETCFLHRLYTVNGDGTDLRLLECADHPLPQLADDFDPNAVGTFDYEKSEYQISHPMWKSDSEVIVWGPHDGAIHYHLYDDTTGAARVIGPGILTENGHMTYSRDGRWILSDTYPDASTNERILFLFDTQTDTRHDLGSFYTPPDLGKHNRCDLHPRWSHDNKTVCIDSVHEGTRQMYLVDVTDIVSE
ncbi:hypothetical protein GCM10016455_09030 [Aliiroseovarius zhejiangensis]|uniref:Oligogalacturonate lyase domain-containing protein n=1 Tax=Aliiroseovarius zhejiangensis TaxID=1632025 RepID=A0ABQ3ITV9_9RHOB|nr:hypothetical protein [Aliiroseovarius zhejiangensis]GHE90817.1 hypothetical protein GCM10016455_09030 [Aliiroseovarius zhejiangensis]